MRGSVPFDPPTFFSLFHYFPHLFFFFLHLVSYDLLILKTKILIYLYLDCIIEIELRFQAQYLIFEKMREEGYVAGTEDVRLTIEILVPSTQVGRIIGKGGQNVRELQRVTGSVIKLSEQQATPPSAEEETTVHIIGPFFSVQVK